MNRLYWKSLRASALFCLGAVSFAPTQVAVAQVSLNPGAIVTAGLRNDDPGGSTPWTTWETAYFAADSPFYGTAESPGGVTSAVFTDDPNNPGHLTFFYQFSNHSAEFISRFTVAGFAGVNVRVGWTGTIWSGIAPASMSRTLDGDWINENFADSTVPSFFGQVGNLFVYTDIAAGPVVRAYQNRAFFLGTAGDSDALAILAPYPVPEPETWAMLLTGLGFLGSLARNRRSVGA